MIRISILAGRRQLDRINPLGHLRRRRGLLVVGALLALATVFGVGTASAAAAGPPVNTSPPVISGTAQSRLILTADPGSWSGDTSGGFSYQWQRCNTQGANCNPISGATNPTYTPDDGDLWATIIVEVTALNGPTVAASAATGIVRYPAPSGGTCQLVPNVGDADDTVFTTTCEGWSDYHQQNPLTYSVQSWGCDIGGGNCFLEYTTIPSVVSRAEFLVSGFNHVPGEGWGADRVVVVICQHLGGCTHWTGTAYVADDGRPHSNPAAPPTVNGDVWLGETLTADSGDWSGNPTIDSYQWLRCPETPGYEHWQRHESGGQIGCELIAGATGMTYTVQPEDRGWAFAVEVTATNEQGQTVISGPTTRRAVHAPPTNIAPPRLNDTGGHPVSGNVLRTDGGSWIGDISGYSYQWQRCDTDGLNCQPIPSANASTYTVQPSDIGSTIVLDMAAINSDGLSTHASSSPSDSVDPTAPANTVQPQIDTSSPLVGTQVSATTGTWTGPPVPGAGDFSYKWYRCGTGCTLIGGATASSYTPVEADFGYKLAVVVTASTAGGSVSSNLSNAVRTDPVAHTDIFLSIDSGPNDLADADSATFTFSSPQEPNVDFECFLDEVSVGSCTSPASYTDLAEGEHSFSVHATDFLGLESGVDTTDPVWEWTIDTTAPAVTFDSAPSGSTSATVASFSFHADDPAATFECKLDDGSWTACVSPQSYNGLTLGGHSYQVRATDAAENVSAPASATWTVISANLSGLTVDEGTLAPAFDTDTDAYTVSVPNGTSSFNLTPTVADSHATVTVNGSTVSSGSASAEALEVGANVFTVVVTAADGTTTRTYTVTVTRAAAPTPPPVVDATAPTITKARFVKRRNGRVWVSVAAVDAGSGVAQIEFASKRNHPRGWRSFLGTTSNRTKQPFIWVRIADGAGNVSAWKKILLPAKRGR